MSDLHLEATRGWDLPATGERPRFDVLVIAGDLMPGMERGVRWIHERVDKPAVYIGGNHENYGRDIDRTVEKARLAALGTNVRVLQNETAEIHDAEGAVTFIGATGWTDFNLFGDQERSMRIAADGMNDYKKIRINAYQQRLRPRHTLARHLQTRAFIEQELAKPKLGRRVVVTHMSFHGEQGIRAGDEHDPLSACYSSRAAIDGADLWVYGHTHETRTFMAGETLVVSNAKGRGPWLPGETSWENKNFDQNFVVEI
jgi:predicted phosphodiesterase